jgi:hypothetical protein
VLENKKGERKTFAFKEIKLYPKFLIVRLFIRICLLRLALFASQMIPRDNKEHCCYE